MFKAGIFDLDDTLYNYQKIHAIAMEKTCDYACINLDINKEIFYKAFESGKENTKKVITYDCASKHNRIIYFQKMLEFLGANPITYALELYDVYWDTMLDQIKLNDGVIKLFKYLKSRKIKIAICTDLTTHIQHRKLRKLGIQEYIDCIVTSEEAGLEKPNPIMFNLCLKKLNIIPEQAFYIGDSFKKDIIGAHNIGMFPIWFNVNKKVSISNDVNFKEIKKIDEVIKICEEISGESL
ncbi:HAD family hydrolase [Clostridium botulinum]|uniref:HAD family hydrolase n=1 Tax=Clostridium botulinum TaxID=1491 RepID=UPI0019686647|nr:HAD-IA family hydrolase [Clostridium botulinum]MBN1075613.1 HAD family hydrolase [Clostridium botulinum]